MYVSNPRHKNPWQPGERGTLCPRGVDGRTLFENATPDPGNPSKRYNTDGTNAYCAHPDKKHFDEGETVTWHGFPVEWRQVPCAVQRDWIKEGRIKKLRLRG